MPEGTARNVGTDFWSIVDDTGSSVARFYRSPTSAIRDGARVTYTRIDANGIAHNVQPVAAVARLMSRNPQLEALAPSRRDELYDIVMDGLAAAAGETGAVRQRRLRRLRSTVDRFEA